MHVVDIIAPAISEPLTWAAICERYPDQWVCLVEIDRIHPNDFAFRTARVIGHGQSRGEPLDQARPWRQRYRSIAHYSTRRPVAHRALSPRWFLRVVPPVGPARFYPRDEPEDEITAVDIRPGGAR